MGGLSRLPEGTSGCGGAACAGRALNIPPMRGLAAAAPRVAGLFRRDGGRFAEQVIVTRAHRGARRGILALIGRATRRCFPAVIHPTCRWSSARGIVSTAPGAAALDVAARQARSGDRSGDALGTQPPTTRTGTVVDRATPKRSENCGAHDPHPRARGVENDLRHARQSRRWPCGAARARGQDRSAGKIFSDGLEIGLAVARAVAEAIAQAQFSLYHPTRCMAGRKGCTADEMACDPHAPVTKAAASGW